MYYRKLFFLLFCNTLFSINQAMDSENNETLERSRPVDVTVENYNYNTIRVQIFSEQKLKVNEDIKPNNCGEFALFKINGVWDQFCIVTGLIVTDFSLHNTQQVKPSYQYQPTDKTVNKFIRYNRDGKFLCIEELSE